MLIVLDFVLLTVDRTFRLLPSEDLFSDTDLILAKPETMRFSHWLFQCELDLHERRVWTKVKR